MTKPVSKKTDTSKHFSHPVKIESQLHLLIQAMEKLFDKKFTSQVEEDEILNSIKAAIIEMVKLDSNNGAETIMPVLDATLNALNDIQYDETALEILYDLAKFSIETGINKAGLADNSREVFQAFLVGIWKKVVGDYTNEGIEEECVQVLTSLNLNDRNRYYIFKSAAQEMIDSILPETARVTPEVFVRRLEEKLEARRPDLS